MIQLDSSTHIDYRGALRAVPSQGCDPASPPAIITGVLAGQPVLCQTRSRALTWRFALSLVPGMSAVDIGQLIRTDPWSWSAVSGSYDGTTFVIVNDAHTPARQESNLHHEAAHLIRGHHPSRLLQVDGLTLREYDDAAESEAEWLAGCRHLPRAALVTAVKQGDDDSTIGQKFLASAEMVRFRRSVTGIDRQRAFGSRRRGVFP